MENLKLFISYSHEDEKYKNRLLKFLMPLEKEQKIDSWHDREIKVGSEVSKEIDQNLYSSQIIILLVSQDFIASEYCYNKELATAMEMHEQEKARVIPIILRDCSWKDTPLVKLQVLPSDGQPISTWNDEDSAYMNILSGVKKAINTYTFSIRSEPGNDIMDPLREDPLKMHQSEHKSSPKDTIYAFKEKIYENAFAEWYDDWYEGHWQNEQPFKTICGLLTSHFESSRGYLKNLRILDCACGTGNTFVSFSRAGMHIWGTDGSKKMLEKAQHNCKSIGVPTEKLILTPLTWTDEEKYFQIFKHSYFDVIINTANSYCHLPPVDEYMLTSLKMFFELLKPGGILLIDTKKFITSSIINDIQFYKELRYHSELKEWIERDERKETVVISKYGKVHFHTKMMYDIDYSFSTKVERAFIVVSVYGDNIPPETFVIPYYPLPGRMLINKMQNVGFKTNYFPAFEGPLISWKYDIIAGIKPN